MRTCLSSFLLIVTCIKLSRTVTVEQFEQSLDMMRNGCAPKFKLNTEQLDALRSGYFDESNAEVKFAIKTAEERKRGECNCLNVHCFRSEFFAAGKKKILQYEYVDMKEISLEYDYDEETNYDEFANNCAGGSNWEIQDLFETLRKEVAKYR